MNDEARRLLEYEEMKELFLPHLGSELGKNALRRLRPFDSESEVRRSVEEAREVHALADRGHRLPLGGCHDLGPLLTHVHEQGRPFEPDQLNHIRETLDAARNLVVAVEGHVREYEDLPLPRLEAIASEIPGLTVLTDRIGEVVDGRGRVRDGASPKLGDFRSRIRTVRDRIEQKVGALFGKKEMRSCFQETTPRFRSGRVVLAVKTDRRGEIRGILHDVSQTGATSFVEPEAVVAEGNELEDLLAQERREVTRILWDLTVGVLDVEPEIRSSLAALARADLAVGVVAAAREHGLAYPVVVPEPRLNFRRARHPLLLLIQAAEETVPVDIRLGEDFRLLVITGPNTGGKTVTLKTAGLLVLMAQSGLPVPAEEAEVGMFEEVFADIGDEQSLQQSLSTFSSHVKRIARFLAAATERTLVLIDELGAGTDPAEGAALGEAILDYLHARGAPTVVTTHLGSLKTYAFTRTGASNACVEFDVESLSPTYRLLLGQPGASNALVIAERLGIPPAVVAAARKLVDPGDRRSVEILEKAQAIRSQAETHLREAEQSRVDSKGLREKAEEEFQEARTRRRHVEAEAEEEMDRTLLRIRRLVVEFAKEMGNAPKPFGPKAGEFLARAEEEIRATPLMRRREEYALSLHRGDEVYVPRLRERLMVHQVRKKDRTLTLMKGNMRIEVPFSDVTWTEA